MDQYTEVTHQGCLGRIFGSFIAAIIGVVLFLVSFGVLFWNESRAVTTARSLEEGAGAVVSVSSDKVEPANNGKLVHMSGEATTTDEVTDDKFGVTATALKMRRKVEMYQWKENKTTKEEKTLSGGKQKTTTYTYEKVWSDDLIKSSSFKQSSDHSNPDSMPAESQTFVANTVTVGAFQLPAKLVDKLDKYTSLEVTEETAKNAPETLGSKSRKEHNGGFYFGDSPDNPKVGDVRVKFEVVQPGQVSLIAKQSDSTFEPYHAKAGDDIELIVNGTKSAADMFKAEQEANTIMTWILRVVGFFLMFIGLNMIASPLTTIPDTVPLIGGIFSGMVGFVVTIFSFGLAIFLSFITIAVSWILVRPLLGLGLLAFGLLVGGGIFVLATQMKKK